MLLEKIKGTAKSDFYAKAELNGKRPCGDGCSIQPKDNFKDYVNEIFAGLMWLG